MSKLLFISTGLSRAGAEIMLYDLLSHIDRDRFEPVVISLMDRGDIGKQIEQLNIPVHSIGMLSGKPTIASAMGIIKLIKKIEPDLIQGWMYHGNLAAQLYQLFAIRKIPIIWSIHHSLHQISEEKPLTQGIIRFGSWSSKFVAKVAYVSEKSQAQHLKIGYCQTNSCLIPNGFDTSRFKSDLKIRQKFRQELNLNGDTFLIGSIARYHPMKDHANFIKAAKVLLTESPETKFVMVGSEVDYENQTLTNLIDELGICDSVYLLGERKDIPQITPALDLLTSSSAYGEAFPLVLGEAMSCGVSCVVTDIGDSAWIVGDTGKVVPPKNPTALAKAWLEMINMDKSIKANLGQSARNRIIEKFSLVSIVNQYEDLYQSLSD